MAWHEILLLEPWYEMFLLEAWTLMDACSHPCHPPCHTHSRLQIGRHEGSWSDNRVNVGQPVNWLPQIWVLKWDHNPV